MTGKRTMDPLLLLGLIVVIAAALTWVIPAGQYDRVLNSQTGATQVVPGSYKMVPAHPVGLGGLLQSIPEGMNRAASIVFFVLLSGAALSVVEITGAIGAILNSLVKRLHQCPLLILPMVSLLFLFGGASYSMYEEIVAFIPLLCVLMRKLQLPGTMAVAVSVGSASVGAVFSPFNTYALGISQPMVGLPLFSGFAFRSVVFVVAILVWLGYLMWQGRRMRIASQLAGQDTNEFANSGSPTETSARYYLVLLILISGMAFMIAGAILRHWDLPQFSAALIAVGVLAGLAGGLGPRGTSEAFSEGLRRVAFAAVLVGVARAVSVILEQGMIMDTITDMLFRPLRHTSTTGTAVMMLGSQAVIGLPMPSDGGRAMLTLPILAPLADLLHISRQVVVLAYQYGGLFSNILSPTAGALVAMVTMARVSFVQWLRFVLPIYLVLFLIAAVSIIVAVRIGLQ